LREFLASALLRRRVKIYVYSERVFTTETQNSLRVYLCRTKRVAPEYRVVSFDSVTFLQPNPVDCGSGLGSNFYDSTSALRCPISDGNSSRPLLARDRVRHACSSIRLHRENRPPFPLGCSEFVCYPILSFLEVWYTKICFMMIIPGTDLRSFRTKQGDQKFDDRKPQGHG